MLGKIKVGYIGWVNRSNVGDEAIYKAFEDEIMRRHPNDIEITAAQELNPQQPFDVIILGGGDLLSPWAYGWDVEYAHFLTTGAKGVMLGCGSRNFYDIESVSNYNIDNFMVLKNNMEKSEAVFVRDEVTKAYVSSLTQKEISCIGDLALILDRRSIDDKIASNKLKFTDKTVAINVANSYNECFGLSDDKVAERITKICTDLIIEGYDVKLFSMYSLDNVIVKKIADQVHLAANKELDVITHDFFTPKEWVDFFHKCAFVISERLHGCILAAAAETPFISLAYRWKCINFCLLMGVPHLAIKTDNMQGLETAVDYVKGNLLEIRKQITTKKIDYSKKIYAAFDKIDEVIETTKIYLQSLINDDTEHEVKEEKPSEQPKYTKYIS